MRTIYPSESPEYLPDPLPPDEEPALKPEATFDIKTETIADIAPALFDLARKIVEAGKAYDLVLSDDASGRLVSLFLKKVMDGVQEKNGLEKTDIRFVASGRHDSEPSFSEIRKILADIGPKRTLLVTELIATGESIKKLIHILNDLELKFDLAALSVDEYNPSRAIDSVENSFDMESDTEFYYGEIGSMGQRLYDRPSLSGVTKTPDSAIPKKALSGYPTEVQAKKQASINQAREDIDLLAKETLKELGI